MADLKRYFIGQKLSVGQSVELSGSELHHLSDVMRQKAGDSVILLCKDGFDYTARIESINKKSAVLSVYGKEKNTRETKFKLTVLCGLLKGEGSENQVSALSELGVYKFIPFISRYCTAAKSENKTQRLRRKALESAKQCKRAYAMEVGEILSFADALESVKDLPVKIIAYECEKHTALKTALQNAEKEAALVIGSEGGFAEEEILLAQSKGFTAATLGKTILKANTAATAAAAAMLYNAGEWE